MANPCMCAGEETRPWPGCPAPVHDLKDHIHHFVPRPTGTQARYVEGGARKRETIYVHKCDCGMTPREARTNEREKK